MTARTFMLALATVLALALPAAAQATTIDFGSPAITPPGPGGPYVSGTTQPWDAQGIDFNEGSPEAVADPASLKAVPSCSPELYSDAAHALPDSGGQALRDVCYDTEHFSSWSGWIATLHDSTGQVSMDLLSYGVAGTAVTLTGYDFSGDPVQSYTAKIPSSGSTLLQITVATPDIYFFSVDIPDRQNVSDGGFEVDDVSFTPGEGGTPEILLEPTAAEGYPGEKTRANYAIERFNGASDTVVPSVSGLPSYVTSTATPTIAAGADSGSLSFKIDAVAPAPMVVPFTLSATSTGVTIAPETGNVLIGNAFVLSTVPGEDDISLVAGAGAQTIPVQFSFGGTVAPIKLSASGLPTGVTATFTPKTVSGTLGSFAAVTVGLKAAGTAAPETNFPITITAKVTGSSTIPSQSVTLHLWVSTFVLRAQGMAVTQGTEPDYGVLVPSGLNESGDTYSGVPLVADKKTVVRFFADAYGAPAGVPGVFAQLTAYRYGVDLGSIYNDYGPGTKTLPARLTDTGLPFPAAVNDSELESNANAFTFTLPRAWTYYDGAPGTIKLVAQVMPPWTDGNKTYTQDCGASCPNTFVLNDVHFNVTGSLTVTPISMSANGKSPSNFDVAFAYPSAVLPLADDGYTGFMWLPYQAYLNISSIENAYGPNPTQTQQNTINSNGLARVQTWVSANGNPTNVIGVSANANTRGLTAVPGGGPCPASPECFNGAYDNPTTGGPSIVDMAKTPSNVNRPLTSVSHELFHQLGMLHAGPNCPGNPGAVNSGSEYWPPDQQGELDGIALNTTAEPYTVIANGLNGYPFAYDFMSYCAAGQVGGGDPNIWVSPTNWQAVYSEFELPGPGPVPPARDSASVSRAAAVGASRLPSAAATVDTKVLSVNGFQTAAGLAVSTVGPRVGPPLARGASSYTLTALSATHKMLARVPMLLSDGHFDGLGPFVELRGEVPAAGVNEVEITSPTGQLATRTRPVTAPKVRVVAPAAGSRVGGTRPVIVTWRSTNPEHLSAAALSASIDYSANGGKRWRTIWIGGNTGRVTLPGFAFARSTAAIVRLRVNDGFNETPAASARFTVLDPPPEVSILAPQIGGGGTIAGDAPVQLEGDAWDAQLQELGGTRLTWYDGNTRLGTGDSLLAGPLPPGINVIRLFARDPAGRIGIATRKIDAYRVALPFLHLQVPASIAAGTDALTIGATSALPATLSAGSRAVRLAPAVAGRLQLPVKPGATPLIVRLAITANGIQVPFAVRVAR